MTLIGPFSATTTTDSHGQATILVPVEATLDATEIVTGSSANQSVSATISFYSTQVVGECHYDGSPNKLNSLSGLLDNILPGSPGQIGTYVMDFSNWLGLFTTGLQFKQDTEMTVVSGVELTGQGLSPLYALSVEVDRTTGAVVSQSPTLFSANRDLVAFTGGEGGGGTLLEQIDNRFHCGPLA